MRRIASFVAALVLVAGAGGPTAQSPSDPMRAAADALFTDPAMQETRALIVMIDGKPVYERYAAGYPATMRLISWSMAKTVTSVLVGILVADGKLEIDAPAPVALWADPADPRHAITIRELLQMRSGLSHTEFGDPIYNGDAPQMLVGNGAADMAAYGESKPLEAPPGAKFEYSSASSVILADIITNALTPSKDPVVRRDAMLRFMRERLTGPAGLPSFTPEFDAQGTFVGGSLLHATARDYARFGEMLRGDGTIDGKRIVPAQWVRFMTSSSPRKPGYGAHIWLNRGAAGEDNALFPGHGGDRLFACLGHVGQYIIVSPDQHMTIVRLGKTDDSDLDPVKNGLQRIVDAVPAKG